jgi:hypothetical protein
VDFFRSHANLPKLQLAPHGTKNVDALSRTGERYSIKTIWKAKKTGTIYPDPTDKDKHLFEHLIVARLGDDWTLEALYQFSWSQFVRVRSWDKRMSAWYVGCSDKVLQSAQTIMDQVREDQSAGRTSA